MFRMDKIKKFLANRTKGERMGLYLAFFLVSMAFLDRLFLNPIVMKMEELDKRINQQDAVIQKDLHILNQKDVLESEIGRYESFMIESASEEEEITSLLKEIEGLASQSNVYVIDIKSKGAVQEGYMTRYLVDIHCEAQMEQLVRFLYHIESADTLLKVSRYNLSPVSKDSSMLKATISIYRLRTHLEA